MSATLILPPPPSTRAPARSPEPAQITLREKMLAAGWSPDDIRLIQSALISARLHETYRRAGYSPDEIEQITSIY
jgi:hypothetical protein